MNNSFVSDGSTTLLSSNRAIQGAFERIAHLSLTCSGSSVETSYGDDGDGGFEDSDYVDCPGE